MPKPKNIDGYSDRVTRDCERVRVTLLRNLGPWKKSVFLVGGLTPRYLVPLAFEDRAERKDAHDLVYCMENAPGGVEAAAAAFRGQLEGKHRKVVHECVEILRKHFAGDEKTEGYLKDGPGMVAHFELDESVSRELRTLRQRNVSAGLDLFLDLLGTLAAS